MPGDLDWYVFQAEAGVRYRFFTDNLTLKGDTLLTLVDADGNELTANDDVGPGFKWSALTWEAPATGTYYLLVTRPDGGGVYFLYDLVASRTFDLYLPLVWTSFRPHAPRRHLPQVLRRRSHLLPALRQPRQRRPS